MERGTERRGWGGAVGGGGGGSKTAYGWLRGGQEGGGVLGQFQLGKIRQRGGDRPCGPGLAGVRNFQQNEGGRGGTEERVAQLFVKLLE